MPTVSVRVAAGGDDGLHAEATHLYSSGSVFHTIGDSDVSGYGNYQRFLNILIPNAATITVAYITLTGKDDSSGGTCTAVIEAEDEDSPTAVVSNADWHALSRTTASVTWSPVAAVTTDEELQTPSIVTVVQELVNRGGWASGNNMQFLVHDDAEASSANAYRNFRSYDDSTTKAPLLTITYTTAAGTKGSALLND